MSGAADRLAVVVLISGSGTNLQALIDAAADDGRFTVACVISNRADAGGLARAAAAGIPTRVVDHTRYADRAGFDSALGDAIDACGAQLIVLAGFMRILTDALVARFRGRMLNIHPSLLPAFQGLHTHRRALEAGVREHGASVHFVTAELDGGPVIAQARVPVLAGDDAATLAARVLAREHVLLPEVVRWYADGRLEMRDGRAWLDGAAIETPRQC
ncbi:MAG: phosphoribosylglycinamide formyltransferase [Gammaproteobacteria bacterium]|nr:phosphoribosylglycinamide formyltransferase [Gammaproteobacteria bacterium]